MTVTGWVIGGRGMLGGAITREIRGRNGWRLIDADPLPWHDSEKMNARVSDTALALLDRAGNGPWTIIWAAGAAVTASSTYELALEREQLRRILDVIGGVLDSTDGSGPGSIFYASSAGGVYAGSCAPPFTEETVPRPISPYGRFKLDAEAIVADFGLRHRVTSVLGRIANLYGPGQKLEKMQGLISHIALAQLSRTPAAIYVPLDTVRDYLFVDDCARLICDLVETVEAGRPAAVTKILASGQGVTVGALLGLFGAISKHRPRVTLGSSPAAAYQTRDLRLRSVVLTGLDARNLTPLSAGIGATMQDILLRLQEGTR